MRRVMSLLIALAVCLTLACPAFADTFVPSITYKDGPDIDAAVLKDEDVGSCLVVTSILEAKEKSTDITQEARDQLLALYDDLNKDVVEPPLDADKYVIRELVDISFAQGTCELPGHGHAEELKKTGVTATVTLDMGLGSDVKVRAFVYLEGKWIEVADLVNNGDGTITGVFEDICPVAFCVELEDQKDAGKIELFGGNNPKTGDAVGANLSLWIGLAAGSLLGLIALFVVYRKRAK